MPIILGREDDVVFARGNAPQVVEKTGSGERTVELTRARVESLLKPDAGRDDIFQAAGQGLTGVPGDLVQVGWWDTRSRLEASPELELQALNDSSRAELIGAVLLALKEALENIEENGGSLRELIKRVARVSANDWMRSMSLDVGAEERCARVVSLAGDAADEKIWQNGESYLWSSFSSTDLTVFRRRCSRGEQSGALRGCSNVFGQGAYFVVQSCTCQLLFIYSFIYLF